MNLKGTFTMLKRKILSLIIAVAVIFGIMSIGSAATESLPFPDVPESKWFYDSVKYVYERGIMLGVGPDSFAPNSPVTRAMFTTVLGRLSGDDEKETSAFPDVVRGTWYSGWVGWASEAGIVLGFEDGTFAPDRPITRAEMAAIITRDIDYINLRFTRYIDAPKRFTDADEIASWAKSYIETMRRVGIIRGNADGSFNPDGKLTRAEAATVIERMDKAIGYLKI